MRQGQNKPSFRYRGDGGRGGRGGGGGVLGGHGGGRRDEGFGWGRGGGGGGGGLRSGWRPSSAVFRRPRRVAVNGSRPGTRGGGGAPPPASGGGDGRWQ